ncbi:hypothetical protein HYY74_02995 [Candidatus Woesearchaeota archaeon]|nr:hypothetical protein [Candidatus Woesearchaeota archaeon]
MRILGINHSHDAGAAIVEDGRIIAAVNEERLNRVKLFWGFPVLSIREVLRISSLRPADIDYVAVSNVTPGSGIGRQYHEYNFRRRMMSYMAYAPFIFGTNWFASAYRSFYSLFRQRGSIEAALREFGLQAQVHFVEHHVGHAASAFYTSPFDQDTLIVTTDGAGDGLCASISVIDSNNMMQRVSSTPFFHSPASIYGYVTYNLGFTPNKDEGKLTGLAAHGKAEKTLGIFEKVVSVDGLRYKVNMLPPWGFKAVQKLHRIMWHKRREDIAAGLQRRSEQVAVQLVSNALKKYPRSNIALAGGLFANVRVNQEISRIKGVKRIFIHPHMGDGGQGVGAAYALWADLLLDKGQKPRPVFHDNVYLGPEYSDEQIEAALAKSRMKYNYSKDIEAEVAELVKEKKVVGRFNGRMEYGPRALGNRSILADPTDRSINDWLNKKLRRCYDDQTEVLTSKGWKNISALGKEEIVATLNPRNNMLEYQKILDYVSYEVDEELYSIKNNRIDLLVTAGHNMWIKRKHSERFEFAKIEEAAKIKTYHYQKKGGVDWGGRRKSYYRIGGKKVSMELWLEFLGYYLSEGTFYYDRRGHYRVSVAQARKSDPFMDIKHCIELMPYNFFYSGVEFTVNSKELYDAVKGYGKAREKYIPRELLNLPKDQLSVLFDALMKGDGNIRGSGFRYATTSPLLADNVQELALKLGFSAYISKQKRSGNPRHRDLYMVRIGMSPVATVRASQIRKVNYKGKVYCVSVPNRLLYVRRNGKSVFCGNTEFMPFAPSMMREHAEEYFNNFAVGEYAAKFMTITFDCTKTCAENAAAITHIDNTARPQTVTKEQNPSYYKLLKIYRELTGLPIFVNTSFNEHEQPIVCTPKDAIDSFKQGNIDVLAIGDYIVE